MRLCHACFYRFRYLIKKAWFHATLFLNLFESYFVLHSYCKRIHEPENHQSPGKSLM